MINLTSSLYTHVIYPIILIGDKKFEAYRCTYYHRDRQQKLGTRYQLLVNSSPQSHTLFQTLEDVREYLRDEWDQWLYYKFDEVEA